VVLRGNNNIYMHLGHRARAQPRFTRAISRLVLLLAVFVPNLAGRFGRLPKHCDQCGYSLAGSTGRCPECM